MAASLAAAQNALRSGDAEGAKRHYTEALADEAVKGEAHLGLAEMTWQQGDKQTALGHYESARNLAKLQGDIAKEGMISLGLGFALLNSGDDADLGAALEAMRRSKDLAEQQGHAPQVDFVTSLIAQAERRKEVAKRSEEEEQAVMLAAFVSSLVTRAPIMLFMKGTATAPECGFSKSAAAKLMALEIDFDTVDVQKDSKLRDAVKAFSSWPTFPQLFVEGELFGGSDIVDEMVEEGTLLSEISAKLPAEAKARAEAEGKELIEGSRVARKVWPPPIEHECGGGHGEGGKRPWALRIEQPAEDGRWTLSLSPRESGGSCNHHSHGGGGECSHGPPTEPCDHHAEISIDDPQLSDEARAWMAAHPDEKLPLHLCPTEGDCNRCPERHDCKWHSEDGVQPDIEDMLA